jgi:hypothetical protein
MRYSTKRTGSTVIWLMGATVLLCLGLVVYAVQASRRLRAQREAHPPPVYRETVVTNRPSAAPLVLPEFKEHEEIPLEGMKR